MPSFEEMQGIVPAQPTVRSTKPATKPGVVTAEEMGLVDKEEEADAGFLRHARTVTTDWYKGAVENPIDNITGLTKGIAGGMVSMMRLGAGGLAGLAQMAVGNDFSSGAEAVEKFVEADKKFSEGIFYLNLAPKNKQEEAVAKFLGLIPEAITAAGDTVYEKTGSALAGAGTQGLITLLTMKPSIASKSVKGVKKLLTKDLTPKGEKGAKLVKNVFEELAVKDKPAAEAIAEHVGKADPELEALLKQSIEEVNKKSPEDVGREAANKPVKEPIKPQLPSLYKVVKAHKERTVQHT